MLFLHLTKNLIWNSWEENLRTSRSPKLPLQRRRNGLKREFKQIWIRWNLTLWTYHRTLNICSFLFSLENSTKTLCWWSFLHQIETLSKCMAKHVKMSLLTLFTERGRCWLIHWDLELFVLFVLYEQFFCFEGCRRSGCHRVC